MVCGFLRKLESNPYWFRIASLKSWQVEVELSRLAITLEVAEARIFSLERPNAYTAFWLANNRPRHTRLTGEKSPRVAYRGDLLGAVDPVGCLSLRGRSASRAQS
jgi:hypothetical protein